jgi:hypothetical protein
MNTDLCLDVHTDTMAIWELNIFITSSLQRTTLVMELACTTTSCRSRVELPHIMCASMNRHWGGVEWGSYVASRRMEEREVARLASRGGMGHHDLPVEEERAGRTQWWRDDGGGVTRQWGKDNRPTRLGIGEKTGALQLACRGRIWNQHVRLTGGERSRQG